MKLRSHVQMQPLPVGVDSHTRFAFFQRMTRKHRQPAYTATYCTIFVTLAILAVIFSCTCKRRYPHHCGATDERLEEATEYWRMRARALPGKLLLLPTPAGTGLEAPVTTGIPIRPSTGASLRAPVGPPGPCKHRAPRMQCTRRKYGTTPAYDDGARLHTHALYSRIKRRMTP